MMNDVSLSSSSLSSSCIIQYDTIKEEDHRPVRLLVYNVSHVDMLFEVECSNNDENMVSDANCTKTKPYMCRPKFKTFYPVSLKLKDYLKDDSNIILAGRYDDRSEHEAVDEIPIGVDVREFKIFEESWDSLHVRDTVSEHHRRKSPQITSVYFPLIAQILNVWTVLASSPSEDEDNYRLVVFLLSGAGTPRNPSIDIHSNSTKGAAELIKWFIGRCCPRVEVILLDSGLGVFQFDSNIEYCKNSLLPAVERFRRPLVSKFGNEWRNALQLTISLTDGSPARLAAVSAALRLYKPACLHLWQVKTFWFEKKIFDRDLRFHSFDAMETRPGQPIHELPQNVQGVINEMIRYKSNFEAERDAGNIKELDSFWLRKSKKVVLSVLLVQKRGETTPRYFRGMNLEVSMPTGSLCSERNVIGTAIASDPSLARQDLRMIAVLSMSLSAPHHEKTKIPSPKSESLRRRNRERLQSLTSAPVYEKIEGELNPIAPCGACMEWLRKIAEVNPTFTVITFPSSRCEIAFVDEVA